MIRHFDSETSYCYQSAMILNWLIHSHDDKAVIRFSDSFVRLFPYDECIIGHRDGGFATPVESLENVWVQP